MGRVEGANVCMLELLPETFDKRPLVADKVRYIGDEVATAANGLCHALGIQGERLLFLSEETWAGWGHRGK